MFLQIIVIASEGGVYEKFITDYWVPVINYIEEKKLNIGVKLVFNNALPAFSTENKNFICYPEEDETLIPGITNKTMKAFRQILKEDSEVNYILRTNLSSFFIVENLLSVVKKLPSEKVYAGVVGDTNNFVSGAGMMLSRDVVNYLLTHEADINKLKYEDIDDILFGKILSPVYTSIPLERYDITNEPIFIQDSLENHYINILISENFHVRIKNNDRDIDIKIAEYLSRKFGYVYDTRESTRESTRENIKNKYTLLCRAPSDINEHLPTLFEYAKKCNTIFETGVRGVVSSYALVYGLLNEVNGVDKANGVDCVNKSILLNDISECDISELLSLVEKDGNKNNINISSIWKNNLEIDMNTFPKVDLTFIDTWHVYGQLRRELNRFSKVTTKYIILHDTTVDAEYGETIRNGWNPEEQSLLTGIPVEEITKGLWYAVEEFLQENKNWKLEKKYENNNGLTILKKENETPESAYINLLKKCLLDLVYEPENVKLLEEGRCLPSRAHTMIGIKRLNNIQDCFEAIKNENIVGDLIETGVWKGGATIFMAGLNKIYNQNRKIYVADSFEGLPKPDEKYPADKDDPHHTYSWLEVSLEQVKKNFQSYDLLNDNIVFIKGFFEHSLKNTNIEKLAMLRLDGDMYSSTIQVLEYLYDKVSDNGFIIIDDYGAVNGCKEAVDDFRRKRNITEPMTVIDYTGRYWRKK